jgi:hypothetical protein
MCRHFLLLRSEKIYIKNNLFLNPSLSIAAKISKVELHGTFPGKDPVRSSYLQIAPSSG